MLKTARHQHIRHSRWLVSVFLLAAAGFSLVSVAAVGHSSNGRHVPEVTIRINAAKVLNRISPWMYGSCIEDVNHEIYGGLGAQLVFGESFEEPPGGSPLAGWKKYGGQWDVRGRSLQVAADPGAKMVRDAPVVTDGAVECDVRFTDSAGDNAGLVLRVSDPRTGADTWFGYEVSLSIRNQTLVLGRHRNNWRLLKTVPVRVEARHWHHLKVALTGPNLSIYVDGSAKPLLEYVDYDEPIRAGLVGVRTWQSNAEFRDLIIERDGEVVRDSLIGRAEATAQVSGMWQPVKTGSAQMGLQWDSSKPFNGSHSQRISFDRGVGTAGVANSGLNRWGIAVRQGETFAGHFFVRGETAIPIFVALQSEDGSRTHALAVVSGAGKDWSKREFRLLSKVNDAHARLAIWLDRPGTIWIDQVYLAGTGKALFRGGPFRGDIGEALVRQGLTFMRYGGSMVNATEYRWKKMVGDPDRRPPYKGWWYPQSSNRFGIEEFLRFCELAHIEPAFAVNIDETPEDMADMVEYLNGSADSPWGRRRARNGHPKPYSVRWIEIGNEEAIDGSKDWYKRYLERFKALEPAIHRKDPRIGLVVAAWWRSEEPWCRKIAEELRDTAALWDVHVGGDDLNEGKAVDKTLTHMQALFREWIPGSKLKACIFEENGDRHDLQRALGHANILNVTQRHGDFVLMDCPANCLQPLGQNDNGWNQGQVFFTPDKVWGMPPYWAQQMAAMNHLPLRVECEVQGSATGLDVTASRSEDGRTVVLKVVNISSQTHKAVLKMEGTAGSAPKCTVWTLSGEDLHAVNTLAEPEKVRWKRSALKSAPSRYEFGPQSYTILRLEK